jgi:hypothetical protein
MLFIYCPFNLKLIITVILTLSTKVAHYLADFKVKSTTCPTNIAKILKNTNKPRGTLGALGKT